MIKPTIELPGLDRLISTCRAHGLRVDLHPPSMTIPGGPGTLSDQPLDPMLFATLLRFNGGFLHELSVFAMNDTPYGLGPLNARRRADAEWPLPDALLYAKFNGFPYYLATAPSLADNGIQPVVHIILDMELEVMPIASSVDMAFDLYARYLESLAVRYGSVRAGERALGTSFPRSIPGLIAEDRRFIQMLEANRFEAFTTRDANLPEWSATIQRAAEARA